MKIRNGFVSNSSSSSFVIASKLKDSPRIHIEFDVDVGDYGECITSDEELIEYFESEYGRDWQDDKECNKYFDKCNSQILDGNKLYFCTASSDDYDTVSRYIYDSCITDEEVIDGFIVKGLGDEN